MVFATWFICGVFAVTGLLSVLAAVFNWEWFFTAHNSQFIVRNLGRNKARIFYALLGIGMIAAGVYFFLSVQESLAGMK